MKIRYGLMAAILAIAQLQLAAQLVPAPAGKRNVGRAMLLELGYGMQRPGGDLTRRFGANFNAEVSLSYLSDKTNWIIGADWEFLFGNNVREDVLANLRTPEGYIIGNDRSPADIGLRQRGFYVGAHVGKLISLSAGNSRSGIRVQLGAGLLQHKIRVQRDPLRSVAALSGDYVKGYDRLTNGLCLQQFMGYQLLSNDGRLNFYFGLELSQAFTQNRRSYDYLAQVQLNEPRVDLLYGLRLGWVLPIYFGKTASEIYY